VPAGPWDCAVFSPRLTPASRLPGCFCGNLLEPEQFRNSIIQLLKEKKMRQDIIKQLDGYEDVLREIDVSRKYGLDIDTDKGSAADYIKRLHPAVIDLKVSQVIDETASTKTLRLVSKNHCLPPFQAGQYIALYLDVNGIRTGRPYSISSPPNQAGYYDITVRRMESGLVSNFLMDVIKPGDMIQSSGPDGQFVYNPLIFDKKLVFIAGGSGITPFMSMIREITDCGLDREVTLFYGNRSADDIIFHEELTGLARRFKNIRYFPVIEHPGAGHDGYAEYDGYTGFITKEIILKEVGEIKNKTFMLCGPQALYDFCLPELERIGAASKKIRREIYGEPVNIARSPGWPASVNVNDVFMVSIKGGIKFNARAGESLLTSLEKIGKVRPFVCRSGECSLCRTKVLSGRVYQPPSALVRASDRQFGYVHACVSYPLEDLEIMI
jgi:ferredoxin-NADP reductase